MYFEKRYSEWLVDTFFVLYDKVMLADDYFKPPLLVAGGYRQCQGVFTSSPPNHIYSIQYTHCERHFLYNILLESDKKREEGIESYVITHRNLSRVHHEVQYETFPTEDLLDLLWMLCLHLECPSPIPQIKFFKSTLQDPEIKYMYESSERFQGWSDPELSNLHFSNAAIHNWNF